MANALPKATFHWLLMVIAAATVCVLAQRPARADSVAGYTAEAICSANGKTLVIDPKKVVNIALKDVPVQKIDVDKDGTLTWAERVAAAELQWGFLTFLQTYDRSQFDIEGPKDRQGHFDAHAFLASPGEFKTECLRLAAPQQPQRLVEARAAVDDSAKSASQFFAVRKNVTALTVKNVAIAAPASIGFSHDYLADNLARSYEIAIGHTLPDVVDTLDVTPYARFVGVSNTHDKKKDVDVAAAGILGEVFAVEALGWFHNVRFSGEYITDHLGQTAIASSDVWWSPAPRWHPGLLGALNAEYGLFGPEGPTLRVDVVRRSRMGHVFDAGPNPALVANQDYLRVGGDFAATLAAGGHDVLSGVTLSSAYSLLDTVDGAGGVIHHWESKARYQFTTNIGFGVRYVTGTDVDTLKDTRLVDGTFDFRF